jgi:hypothetical protein
MNASAIERFLKAGKKRINIPLVKKLFKEYLFRDVKDTDGRLDRAFESIWGRYESLIISGIYSNSQGDFSGTLGEFSGAVLLYYITNGKEADWTGKDTNSYGEFKRADLVLDVMGIQSKNHKQSSLENFDLTVKLHPKELISRLASSDLIVSNNALENLIVNMGFNESTRRMLSQDFEAIMKNYLAYTMNFSLINDIEDTSNFWLIGGNMLVPASEILIAFKETLKAKEGNKVKVKLTSSYKNQTDSYFHKLDRDENGNTIKNSQPYLEYWRRKNGNWEADIDKHAQTHNNLLTSNKISIITSFNFYDIFLQKLKNFTFI